MNTKEDNVGNQTKYVGEKKSMGSIKCLVIDIFQMNFKCDVH